MAYFLSPASLCTVWRRDSCSLKICSTSPQSSVKAAEPLPCILDPGENEYGAEEGTWAFCSLSQGVNYDFPSKYEPRETAWMAIHQLGCLHPPEQYVTPRAQRRSEERLLPPSYTPLHTPPHPAVRRRHNKPPLGKKDSTDCEERMKFHLRGIIGTNPWLRFWRCYSSFAWLSSLFWYYSLASCMARFGFLQQDRAAWHVETNSSSREVHSITRSDAKTRSSAEPFDSSSLSCSKWSFLSCFQCIISEILTSCMCGWIFTVCLRCQYFILQFSLLAHSDSGTTHHIKLSLIC